MTLGKVASTTGMLLATVLMASASASAPRIASLPNSLLETGLYVGRSVKSIRPDNLPFSPQYPLWSDGASKRRWIWLPSGTAIDASRPDAWEFPIGTRLWKEFSVAARPIETRYIERLADGNWRFATYIWTPDGSDARLADAASSTTLQLPGNDASSSYEVPAEADCRACHEGAAAPVLGVGTLQLSSDRDPGAVHGLPRGPDEVDLRALMARGWLRGLPQGFVDAAPRIAAVTPAERAALGYLHANCGHCHNDNGAPAPVKLLLAQTSADPTASRAKVMQSLLGSATRFRPTGAAGKTALIVAGNSQSGVLLHRMATRNPMQQMPPIGSHLPDAKALALIARWIDTDLPSTKETSP